MKTFTCKEIMNNEGGCDMSFSGENPMDAQASAVNMLPLLLIKLMKR